MDPYARRYVMGGKSYIWFNFRLFPLGVYNYIEIFTLIVGLICLPRLRHVSLRWIVPYLLFIVLVELLGRYIGRQLHKPVAWIFNFSIPIEYLFFSFLYYVNYESERYKKITKNFLIAFPVFVLLYSFIYSIYSFHSIYLKIGSFTMIVFSCLYLADILKSDVAVAPLKIPMFWVASGVLLFNAGEFISNFLMDLLDIDIKKWVKTFSLINNNLILVLYSCISIAIILASWARKETA